VVLIFESFEDIHSTQRVQKELSLPIMFSSTAETLEFAYKATSRIDLLLNVTTLSSV